MHRKKLAADTRMHYNYIAGGRYSSLVVITGFINADKRTRTETMDRKTSGKTQQLQCIIRLCVNISEIHNSIIPLILMHYNVCINSRLALDMDIHGWISMDISMDITLARKKIQKMDGTSEDFCE